MSALLDEGSLTIRRLMPFGGQIAVAFGVQEARHAVAQVIAAATFKNGLASWSGVNRRTLESVRRPT
jgi:hypothetical protein